MPISSDDLDTAVTLESSRTGIVEEPPFHVLVLGDWSANAEKRNFGERRLLEIDRDEFDVVLGKLKAQIELDFEDGSVLRLEFSELDDFHPDAIFRTVPMFSELRELRNKLKSEDTFYSAAREVRERFNIQREVVQSSPEPTEAPAEDLLSVILAKPSGGAAAPKPKTSNDLRNLISDLVRPHLVSVDENEQAGMLKAVDEATSGLMRKILHHKKFQELEAAWRGLYFLVRRTETSSNLRIYILDVSKDELAADLKSAGSLEDTMLYRHLVKDAYDGDPWAVVAGNYGFVPDVEDIATLMRISKVASIGKAPFISHMRPEVIGVHSIFEKSDVREWDFSSNENAGKLWAALCDQTDSAYLGMTIPRFLARLPYGADTEPLETFNFEEFADAPVHDEYCWSNAAFVATQLLAQSFSAFEWEMGGALKQDVEDLPVHVYKDGTETVYKPCGEVLLTEEACNKLMSHGLMPLVSFKNTDRVKLARFQSIADTKLKGRWAQ